MENKEKRFAGQNRMIMNNRMVGNLGEEEAVKHLLKNGYNIIERNYRLKTGEIDIIATIDDFLVFVEVKLRVSDRFGRPADAVGRNKINKIVKTSLHYMQKNNNFDKMVRYDVIEIAFGAINHIEGAFEYSGRLGY